MKSGNWNSFRVKADSILPQIEKSKKDQRKDIVRLQKEYKSCTWLTASDIRGVYESTGCNLEEAKRLLEESVPLDYSAEIELLEVMFPTFDRAVLADVMNSTKDITKATEFLIQENEDQEEVKEYEDEESLRQRHQKETINMLLELYENLPEAHIVQIFYECEENLIKTIRLLEDEDTVLRPEIPSPSIPYIENFPSLSENPVQVSTNKNYWNQHADDHYLDGTSNEAKADLDKLRRRFPAVELELIKVIYWQYHENYEETILTLREMYPEMEMKIVANLNSKLEELRSPRSQRIEIPEEETIKMPEPMNDKVYQNLMNEVMVERKRHDLICQAASRAFSSRNVNEAQKLGREAKESLERSNEAYKQVYMETFRRNNPQFHLLEKVDLHGLRIEEALNLMERALGMARNENVPRMEVVTGKGLHSAGGVAKIKPKVQEFLKNKRMRYTTLEGGFMIVI